MKAPTSFLRTLKTLTIFFAVTLLFNACGSSSKEMEYRENSKMMADSINSYVPGIATETINGISHNFIKTADIKFKVLDVLKSSNKIEDLVKARGGYLAENYMRSEIESSNSIKISEDSILEMKHYTLLNDMEVKVPKQQLDSVLRQLSAMAVFIDYSKLKAEDAKLKLYSNKLAENRFKKFQHHVTEKVKNSTADVKKTTMAEEKVLAVQEQYDENEIETYDLADRVNYSTLTIHIYQAPATFSQRIALASEPEAYEPSFFSKAGAAFLNGFNMLLKLLLFIIDSWGAIVFLILFFLLVKFGFNYLNRKTN
ncbi:MAG: DUF4349 domain-containing protein [Bacteroidia bacterium]|nr:DUF4349 domain-containing protein [Bacteroidia bacterium]